ncbi:MAG: DUF2087 domain-containing protein, partial [Magnetospirillum sp.]|nr:DUF2087 domain-containing protein [Magnetospirillum sp.]
CDHQPGHVELLNMLARSVGCRNFQHFRAQAVARHALGQPMPPPPPPVDYTRIRRLTRHFDTSGRMLRWPTKAGEREPCLWVLWTRLPARHILSEKQMNEQLQASHTFGDYAVLRRALVDCGLVSRSRDGAQYQRVERQPPSEALELARTLNGRR